MRMKRYVAPDMRQALKKVREEQGPDAVILASRRIDDRVEVTIAIDDELPLEVAAVAVSPPRSERPINRSGSHADVRSGGLQKPGLAGTVAERSPTSTASSGLRESETSASPGTVASENHHVNESVNGELRTLRRMLETQLAALAWNDLTRRAPLATELLRELTELGFAAELAAEVADGLPVGLDFSAARRLAIARLADRLPVTGDRWCVHGGVVAIVGPSGVGKSAAIARLAARWVMHHGPEQLALVCADTHRQGAAEQTGRLGRLLGAASFRIDDLADLPALLERLTNRRLVLIDTAGFGPRDAGFQSLIGGLLAVRSGLQIGLTLSASAQAGSLAEVVARFAPLQADACVLTRLDETASLGGALSVLIRSSLPVAYVSEGPGIPDDLRPGRALDLVCLASQLAERHGAAADEDLLSRRFGGTFHVAS